MYIFKALRQLDSHGRYLLSQVWIQFETPQQTVLNFIEGIVNKGTITISSEFFEQNIKCFCQIVIVPRFPRKNNDRKKLLHSRFSSVGIELRVSSLFPKSTAISFCVNRVLILAFWNFSAYIKVHGAWEGKFSLYWKKKKKKVGNHSHFSRRQVSNVEFMALLRGQGVGKGPKNYYLTAFIQMQQMGRSDLLWQNEW